MKRTEPAKRQPPVHIPLSFGDAIRGLLKVDPKQLKKRAVKKTAKGKSNWSNQAKG